MTDWRTKPRTGKSQFYPLIDEIQKRLKQGETYKQIHDDLVANERITLGYHQFTKYIRKVFDSASTGKVGLTNVSAKTSITEPGMHPFANLAPAGDKRRGTDSSIHNPVPDKKRIYGEENK